LLKELNKYCQITGWNTTLESASTWAKEGGGEDPDLFLINSTVYFSTMDKQKSTKTKEFLRMLLTIKEQRRKSQIILLLPEKKIIERDLIVNLIKMQIYNFWFLDSFAEEDVQEFVLMRRTLADVEKYLLEKERELQHLKRSNNLFPREGEKLFKPYHIKSNILTFWSESNTALNCGLALLTALNLAERGFQVALVETVSSVPYLAGCLSVSHPYFNTSHALSMYLQGNNDFIKNCLNHAEKHLASSYATEDCKYLRYLPPGFYFLPDGKRADNASEKKMKESWCAFMMELSRFIIFEQGFHFLIFLASGRNFFNQVVLEDLTYLKFITVDMLPSSVLYGLRERQKEQGKVQIIGTNNLRGINQELKGLREEPFLYPPQTFMEDFLQYVYTQDYRKITRETQVFINNLMGIIGIKVPSLDIEKKSLGERLREYKKAVFGGVL
jgi:hypothetical protein